MAKDSKITTKVPNPWRKNFDYGTNERQERIKNLIRKHKSRKKVAMLDSLALTDPMAGQITVQPYPPAEPAPIGLLDGIYPQEDREGKPVGEAPLYYGIMETHMADDGSMAEESEPFDMKLVTWNIDSSARTNATDTVSHDTAEWDEVYRDTLVMILDDVQGVNYSEWSPRPLTHAEAKAIEKHLLAYTAIPGDDNAVEDRTISADEFAVLVNNVRVIKDVLARPHHTVDPHARKILVMERDKMIKDIVSAINKDPGLLAKVKP